MSGLPPQSVEPGYTTTEFWATTALAVVNQFVVLLTVFNLIHWSDPQKAAVVAVCETMTLLGVAAYTLARSYRKVA